MPNAHADEARRELVATLAADDLPIAHAVIDLLDVPNENFGEWQYRLVELVGTRLGKAVTGSDIDRVLAPIIPKHVERRDDKNSTVPPRDVGFVYYKPRF